MVGVELVLLPWLEFFFGLLLQPLSGLGGAVASASPRRGRCLFLRPMGSLPSSFSDLQVSWDLDTQPVRLLVSASPNQPANSAFLLQQTSTSQLKPAQKPTSEQADYMLQVGYCKNLTSF